MAPLLPQAIVADAVAPPTKGSCQLLPTDPNQARTSFPWVNGCGPGQGGRRDPRAVYVTDIASKIAPGRTSVSDEKALITD
jgi:hypothetical protein